MAFPVLTARDEYGFSEQIRLMFAETGIKFDENTVTDATVEVMKNNGELLFGKVPIVQWDDFKLCESAAIMEHIAVKADEAGIGRGNSYLGHNEMERSMARALVCAANDLRRDIYELYLRESELQDQALFTTTVLPKWLNHLNKLAVTSEANDQGLGPGVHYTFGDVAMFEAMTQLKQVMGDDVLDGYRDIKDYYAKTATRTRLRLHLDNRPKRPIRI